MEGWGCARRSRTCACSSSAWPAQHMPFAVLLAQLRVYHPDGRTDVGLVFKCGAFNVVEMHRPVGLLRRKSNPQLPNQVRGAGRLTCVAGWDGGEGGGRSGCGRTLPLPTAMVRSTMLMIWPP